MRFTTKKLKVTRFIQLFLGKVIITALPPIPTEGLTLEDMDKLMEQTKETMLATFHESSKEVRQVHG